MVFNREHAGSECCSWGPDAATIAALAKFQDPLEGIMSVTVFCGSRKML